MRRLYTFVATLAVATVVSAHDAPAQDSERISVDRIVAVVGSHPILWSDVLTAIAQRRAQGMPIPTDSAAQYALALEVLNSLVDEEVLVQRAQKDTTIKVTDADVNEMVERTIRQVRGQFKSEAEFRDALRNAGIGTPDEYRRMQIDLARRGSYQQQLIEKFRRDGKIVNVSVSESDVARAFEDLKARGQLPERPATVAFRQVIVPPRPTPEAKEKSGEVVTSSRSQSGSRWTHPAAKPVETSGGIGVAPS
jgi:peptidyl-prolyl cis-trans isomerase SurA